MLYLINISHDLYKLCRTPLPDASYQVENHRPSSSGEEDF